MSTPSPIAAPTIVSTEASTVVAVSIKAAAVVQTATPTVGKGDHANTSIVCSFAPTSNSATGAGIVRPWWSTAVWPVVGKS